MLRLVSVKSNVVAVLLVWAALLWGGILWVVVNVLVVAVDVASPHVHVHHHSVVVCCCVSCPSPCLSHPPS